MASYTTNFNLKKPATSDFVDIADINGNMDTIDTELKKRAELDSSGKVKTDQLPEMDYEHSGTAASAVNAHNTASNSHADIREALEDTAPHALTGSGAPTTSTEGVVGQLYINTTDGSIYACTSAEATGYTWKLKTWVTESQLSSGLATKQNASTAITTSNIGSQTVNKAKLATDNVATGTAGLRNQYFSTSEQTPTVNGQICWVYG